jgi:dihydrofolate synthase/folylpolyglutamate synthase
MSAAFTDPRDVFSWAEGFTNLEKGGVPFDKRSYRLDRMRILLDTTGNPERAFRVLHVAGTKGKGSTAALLAGVLEASGEKTGLYASPHVSSALERILVSGAPPEAGPFLSAAGELRDRIERLAGSGLPGGFHPTTFELYTVLAFLAFRAGGCACAVVETGIGGRLDATNVVRPWASIITPLDLEHTEILGDTLAKIAFEKAGIIKPGIPAFIGFQPEEAKKVFREAGREREAEVRFLDEEIEELSAELSAEGTPFRVKLKGEDARSFRLSMLGKFQAENAALAYLTLRRTRPDIRAEAYEEGFQRAGLPGRMEMIRRDPPLVLDGAHTPLAVRRLLESFSAIFPREAVLIFGSVAGKRPREMAEILAPRFRRVFVSTPGSFKESRPEEIFRIFHDVNPRTILRKDPAAALAGAEEESGGRLPILVTGSFYMVAEIRRLLEERG